MDHQCALRSGIRCQKVAESVYFDTSRKTDNHPSVLQKRRAGRNLVPFHLFFFLIGLAKGAILLEKKLKTRNTDCTVIA